MFNSKLLQALVIEEDGSLTDPDGINHGSAADYIGIELLGFCGCGMPEEALTYVRDALAGIKECSEAQYTTEAWQKRDAQFSSNGERYFVWYRLDDLGLIEHGGSVPGWLTEKGREWLEALDEALAPPPAPEGE